MSLAEPYAQTSQHQMRAIGSQCRMSAIFHTSTSAKILPNTSQTSWYDWDSPDDCGSLYADSTLVLPQVSGSGSLDMATQLLRHSVPIH